MFSNVFYIQMKKKSGYFVNRWLKKRVCEKNQLNKNMCTRTKDSSHHQTE